MLALSQNSLTSYSDRKNVKKECLEIGRTARETFQLLKLANGVDALGRDKILRRFLGLKKAKLEMKVTPAQGAL